jgi:hypothetical protein
MNAERAHTCPICKLTDNRMVREDSGPLAQLIRIKCPRCKNFIITFEALVDTENHDPIPKLSAWIRNRNERGAEVPKITTETLNDLQTILPNYSPREKQVILLQNIERKTEFPGQRVVLNYKDDFPLAWASGYEEFFYYISSLKDRGLLSADMAMGLCDVTITADGWDYLEKHDRHIEERTQVFVAMSFSDGLRSIWEGPIYNAITKAGYKPYRVDAEPHSDRIDAKIISEIKKSPFCCS